MHYLAVGCVFRSIGKFLCGHATNSVKLLSTVLGVQSAPSACQFVWADEVLFVPGNLPWAEGEECQM